MRSLELWPKVPGEPGAAFRPALWTTGQEPLWSDLVETMFEEQHDLLEVFSGVSPWTLAWCSAPGVLWEGSLLHSEDLSVPTGFKTQTSIPTAHHVSNPRCLYLMRQKTAVTQTNLSSLPPLDLSSGNQGLVTNLCWRRKSRLSAATRHFLHVVPRDGWEALPPTTRCGAPWQNNGRSALHCCQWKLRVLFHP